MNPHGLLMGTDFVAQERVTDVKRRSIRSRKTCCLKYSTTAEEMRYIMDRTPMLATSPMDHGTLWCMYAKVGDKSYLNRHGVSVLNFCAQMELLSGRTWITFPPCPLLFSTAALLLVATKIMSLPHLSTLTVYSISKFQHRIYSG